MENNNFASKYYQLVITPGTKVWWLLLHHVPSFYVAQLKIISDHFAQRHQKKDAKKLLQEKNKICQDVRVDSN